MNQFETSILDIEHELSKILTDQESFELLIAIIKAAKNSAKESKRLEKSGFSSTPHLKSKAKRFMQENLALSLNTVQETLYLIEDQSSFLIEIFKDI